MSFGFPRSRSVLAAGLAAAGILLAAAGCSGHVAPLNRDPVPPSVPPARHLGSPIVAQVMRIGTPPSASGCPAGWLEVYSPARSPSPSACYRPVGTPVTITFAGVSAVFESPRPAGQQKGPAQYGLLVSVAGARASAVDALIRQAYKSGDALGFSVAGRLVEAPKVDQVFTSQQLELVLFSRSQARQLHRRLVPPG